MKIVDIVDILCVASTLTLFASGMPCWYNIIQKKNVSGVPYLIFLLTLANNICSFYYGYLLNNGLIKVINLIGIIFQSLYISTYIYYSNNKLHPLQLLNYVLFTSLVSYFFISMTVDNSYKIIYVGYLGSFVCLCAIMSPLQGLFQSLREKSNKNISLPLTLGSLLCSVSWALYGIILKNNFILLPNICGVVINSCCALTWKTLESAKTKIS